MPNDIENRMVIGNDDTPCPDVPHVNDAICVKYGCYDKCEKEAHEAKKCLDSCCICESTRNEDDYSRDIK